MADNVSGAIDVPLELFGGLNTELAPSDIPEGVSPACTDVAFLPGSVSSRPGIVRQFNTPVSTFIVYATSYVPPDENPLTILIDALGAVLQEDVVASPGVYTTVGQLANGSGFGSPTPLILSTTAFGRQYFAISDGLHGLFPPVQYDGKHFDRVTQDGPATAPTADDSATAGVISAGVHQCVVMFLTRNGYITAPSPPASWTAAGNFKAHLTNIPIGPPNVVARIVAFTGAGGDNFFYIPTDVTVPAAVSATVIFDNTSTSATLDFSDNALFGSLAIDIPGNNLFAQVVLGPVLGFYSYASRLFAWGEYNKVQNLVNMGFMGGTAAVGGTVPLGWTVTGFASLSYDVSACNVGASVLLSIPGDMVSQPAYQDAYGTPIVEANTDYTFRCWQFGSGGVSIQAQLYSASLGGVISTAQINLVDFPNQQVVEAKFNHTTPAVIPSDLLLRVTAIGLDVTHYTFIGELELIYTDNPYRDHVMRGSYVNNPEGFDGVTGDIGPASDPTPIRQPFTLRDNMYFVTGGGMSQTKDNPSSEPSGWSINQLNQNTGGLSANCVSLGEDWALIASPSGLRIFDGGTPGKVSQEIQSIWESRNKDYDPFISVVNDGITRRAYVGMIFPPVATKLLVLDYRELDSESQIHGSGPIHISFSGKMISSDLSRKWTTWDVSNKSGMFYRSFNDLQFCIYGLYSPSGANLYTFSNTKYSDDDRGQIGSSYTTYFFINHEQEQALQIGSHRKLMQYLAAYLTGIGYVSFTPYADNLTNAWADTPLYQMTDPQNFDFEWGMNVLGERFALKITPTPITDRLNSAYTNGTDKYFNLNKLIVTLRQDPWMPVRGAI